MVRIQKVSFNMRIDDRGRNDMSLPPDICNNKTIVRRGTKFHMYVETDRKYDHLKYELRLIFQADMRRGQPDRSDRTYVDFLLKEFYNSRVKGCNWNAEILKEDYNDNLLTIHVFVDIAALVGRWKVSLEVITRGMEDRILDRYIHPDDLYILFNPWNRNENVYMEEDSQRQEYVLNEFGIIYLGTCKSFTAKPWYFGQFQDGVLDTALDLLDKGGLGWVDRGNPIPVVRTLTALVNSPDDGGVVVGRWKGEDSEYSNGRLPLSWTGSPGILNIYRDTRRPVRYGQCFVYAGVATTLMRVLGIPCRCVTNYNSAHDTDGSITIDINWDSKGRQILKNDSIWNYHVWHEVWMTRPDQPKGYGGWQVADSTPQERSQDGQFVCGPAPVEAVRRGETNIPFDVPFVFAEVNGDIAFWLIRDDGFKEQVDLRKNHVGRFISTKACGSYEREDITHTYKAPEGSAEERAAVEMANQRASNRKKCDGQMIKDCSFTVFHDAERTWVGEDVVVRLHMNNESHNMRTIYGNVAVRSIFYNGLAPHFIKSDAYKNQLPLKPGYGRLYECVIKPQEYLGKLTADTMLEVTILFSVKETGQVYGAKEIYRLRKPHLTIQSPREAEVGVEFTIDISFENPLDTTLTDCVVEVDGLSRDLSFRQRDVAAKGKFHTTIRITPTKKGRKEIVVVFTSKELEDVNGYELILVRESRYQQW